MSDDETEQPPEDGYRMAPTDNAPNRGTGTDLSDTPIGALAAELQRRGYDVTPPVDEERAAFEEHDHAPDRMADELLDAEGYDAAICIAVGEDGTDIGAGIAADSDDPHRDSLWLAAAHLYHVAKTARESGGSASPGDVAVDAVRMLQNTAGGPADE